MHNIEIKLLTQCQEHIEYLAALCFNEITSHWSKDATVERVTQYFKQHLNHDKMPMTFVALYDGKPVGMASLRENDGLNLEPELSPWLGSLVVDPHYRQKKIAITLIDAVKNQAKKFGYKKLYLFAFDKTIHHYYARLGWQVIGIDKYWGHPVTVMGMAV